MGHTGAQLFSHCRGGVRPAALRSFDKELSRKFGKAYTCAISLGLTLVAPHARAQTTFTQHAVFSRGLDRARGGSASEAIAEPRSAVADSFADTGM